MDGSIRVSAKTVDDAITEAYDLSWELPVTDWNMKSLKKAAQVSLESE